MGLKKDLVIGFGLLAIIVLVIGAIIGLFLLTLKAVGVLLIVFGALLMYWMPDVGDYQAEHITMKSIWIGIISIIVGILLVIF